MKNTIINLKSRQNNRQKTESKDKKEVDQEAREKIISGKGTITNLIPLKIKKMRIVKSKGRNIKNK